MPHPLRAHLSAANAAAWQWRTLAVGETCSQLSFCVQDQQKETAGHTDRPLHWACGTHLTSCKSAMIVLAPLSCAVKPCGQLQAVVIMVAVVAAVHFDLHLASFCHDRLLLCILLRAIS